MRTESFQGKGNRMNGKVEFTSYGAPADANTNLSKEEPAKALRLPEGRLYFGIIIFYSKDTQLCLCKKLRVQMKRVNYSQVKDKVCVKESD